MLKESFDIPDDDLLIISRNLERIFSQNCAVRRESPIPPALEVEPKEVSSKYGTFIHFWNLKSYVKTVAYLARVLRCFSTRNIGTIYFCHRPLAPAILGQYITVSTRNSKDLNTPLQNQRGYACSGLYRSQFKFRACEIQT